MGEGYDDAACRAHLSGVIRLSLQHAGREGKMREREVEKRECLEVEKASMAKLSLAHSAMSSTHPINANQTQANRI